MDKGDNAAKVRLDLLIKLGGAAITDKSKLETLQLDALKEGALLIKQCHDRGLSVALVHGAGSYGHHHAKKYKVSDGLNQDKDYHGFCLTRNSVTQLNKLVVECLTDLHLPAVACPAFPNWQTSLRSVTSWPQESIEGVLHAGLLPVFHGDCVLDTEQGFCILSGDTIIQTLCSDLNVKRVVFLTDVQGVYDRPPCEEGANLLHFISITPEGNFCSGTDVNFCNDVTVSVSSQDVTGGMLTKLHSAQKIVETSSGHTRVFITRIGSEDAQRVCLEENIDVKDLKVTEIVNYNI